MNAPLAAAVAAVLTFAYWSVAAEAAKRRRLPIGVLPAMLPAGAACAVALAAANGAHASALAALPAVAVAGLADARTGSIVDPLTFTLLGASIGICCIEGSLASGAAGIACVGAALLMLYAMTAGRGLGLGDVKLGAGLGMALGLASGLTAIGLAFIFGGAYGAWLLVTKRARRNSAIRFGPFIAAGTFVALFVPAAVYR